MRVEVILPKWGMQMTEGDLTEWLVSPGDHVVEGDPIAIVETEKVETELPSPVSGRIAKLVAEEGATVLVGSVVAYIEQ